MAAESKLEKECRRLALERGCELLKWVSPGVCGVPDRIFLGPNGRLIFMEFKAPRGGLSPAQCRWGARLQELGFEVWVIDKLEVFVRLLRSS